MKLDEKKKIVAEKMKSKKSQEKKGWYGAKGFDEHYVPKAHRTSQKGKESLNIPRGEKNQGNKMQEGKNENGRF